MKKNNILRRALEEWGEPVNPKVVDAVLALNAAGIKTTMSGDLYSDDLVYIDFDGVVSADAALPAGWVRTVDRAAITISDLTGQPPRWGNGMLMCRDAIALDTMPENYRRIARAGSHPVSSNDVKALVASLSRLEHNANRANFNSNQ